MAAQTSSNLPHPAWLEKAVFYQIYPQSFYDSNGDGIGDLAGVIRKLDYLAGLGVNALWLNPCFESPFQDAGYDVSDYYKVATRYGTNEDLRTLFNGARKRGLRVLLDLVPGHTSVEHAWFKASSKMEHSRYSDWYIWTGSAWEWDVPGYRVISGLAERDASYITNFFWFQPALNYGFAHPDPSKPWQQPVAAPGPQQVRQEMRNIMKFWLEMGANGFRVDMVHSLVKNDPDHEEIKRLWQENRAWLEREFPDAVLVSEWSDPVVALAAGFHMDFLLPFGTPGWAALFRKPNVQGPACDPYGFSFFDRSGHGNIREFLDNYLQHYLPTRGKGLIAFPTGNHDVAPRLGDGRGSEDLKLVFLMLLTWPGVPFIYYGDEIGMRTVKGLASKEGGYDRTGVRTPMQWDPSVNAGFSTAAAENLYLPVDPDPQRPDVASQESRPDSLLSHVRQVIALRKNHPALEASAGFEPVYAERGRCPFVYLREGGQERLLMAINPSDNDVEIELPQKMEITTVNPLYGYAKAIRQSRGQWTLSLPRVAGGIYQI
jgi:glycosidase